MQAQEQQAPSYLGLWTRLRDVRPDALSAPFAERQAVQSG
ncbi:MAG: hypothetical protein ACJ75Q_12570 [Gaiellaceae bacterium]